MVIVQFVTKKTITVCDNTIQAESLGNFFKNLGKKGLNVSKKLAKNVFMQSNTSFRYYNKHCYCSSF